MKSRIHTLQQIRFASSSSSKRWVARQTSDKFAQDAKNNNYRSRAAYKLIELDEKFKIFNSKTNNIVDLGFAPGAWTQVALERTSKNTQARILGVDLIKCTPPEGSQFLQGDIRSKEVQKKILQTFDLIDEERRSIASNIDLIISDMMANTTGNKSTDHFASMDLCSEVVALSDLILKESGNIVMKFFTGKEDALLQRDLEQRFKKVYRFKPQASRDELREMFLIGIRKK